MKIFERKFLIVPGAVGYGDRLWIQWDEHLSKDLHDILNNLSVWGGFDKRYCNLDTGETMFSFEIGTENLLPAREACVADGYTEITDQDTMIQIFQHFKDHR